jgi:four helix bundle protein
MERFKTFEDLEVYKKSISFTVQIYELLKTSKLSKEFALNDQLKRATLSITNNIAEGFERDSDKEYIRFLYFSKASAGEVRNILNVMMEVKLIDEKSYFELKSLIIEISKQLSNYINFIRKRASLI